MGVEQTTWSSPSLYMTGCRPGFGCCFKPDLPNKNHGNWYFCLHLYTIKTSQNVGKYTLHAYMDDDMALRPARSPHLFHTHLRLMLCPQVLWAGRGPIWSISEGMVFFSEIELSNEKTRLFRVYRGLYYTVIQGLYETIVLSTLILSNQYHGK